MSDSSYLFVFGRTPVLSLKELLSFFPSAYSHIPEVGCVDSPVVIDEHKMIEMLGGTVKIAQKIATVSALDGSLAEYLTNKPNITFGVSLYGGGMLPKTLLTEIKDNLESRGVSARYVVSHDGESLSSVTLDKRHVDELIVYKHKNEYIVGKTVAVQDYDLWSKRDYGRPRADAKSGMLPIKVARMLINIANAEEYGAADFRQKTIYDPFCGMGTILSEGYLRGCRMIGSDVSASVIEKVKQNISWLIKTYPHDRGIVVKAFLADAVHASEILPAHSIHAIVTEPFMGSTEIALHDAVSTEKVRNQLKGLDKLYIGCLRDWHGLLAEKGKIIIALPSYAINGREYAVKKVVDMCENLGYTIEDGPIEYSRSHAVVKRQFYIFQKK